MEKSNFKKMALMGMAGGMLLASQSPISADNAGTAGTYLAGGCGGKGGGCGGYKGGSADNLPTYYHQPQQQPQSPQSRGSCGSKRGYTADASSETQTQANYNGYNSNSRPLTEAELLSQLNEQGRATYQSLTPEGRALALTYANQGTPSTDKNESVKLAAQKMSERRNSASTRPAGY